MARVKRWIIYFLNKTKENRTSAYAAQSAFFLLLSAAPFAMFVLLLLRSSPLTYNDLLRIIDILIPGLSEQISSALLNELYSRATFTVISFSVISLLWAAGRGILSMIGGLNEVYGIKEYRNYFHLRLLASLYMFVFAIMLLFTLGLLVFGDFIYRHIIDRLSFLQDAAAFVISIRFLLIFSLLLILFICIYKVLPGQKIPLIHVIPGAVSSSLGWLICSRIFSLVFSHSTNFSYMYGSLASIVLLMLWLYTCMYIVFMSAELNHLLHPKADSRLNLL